MKPQSNLVTISIPTYNSAKHLKLCLEAIANQTYPDYEINIIDGGSKDETVKIAQENGVKKENILVYKGGLLGARYEGVKMARGEYVLMLDSDQILVPDALKNCVQMMGQKFDYLVLEEGVYKTETFIEKLFEMDRKLIHTVKDFSPYTGVMLPRFYKKAILEKALEQIPEDILKKVGGQDHAIIYFEAWNLSQKVGMAEHTVKHIEPSNIKAMIKKFYRWGQTSIDAHFGKYNELLAKKENFRTGMFKKGLIKESIGSILLLLIKGVPYKSGYYKAKLTAKHSKSSKK